MSKQLQQQRLQRGRSASRSQQTSVGASSGSSGGGGRGLTNSGPIVRIGLGGPPPTNTPPLVKSKLALNPASTRGSSVPKPPIAAAPMGPPPMASKPSKPTQTLDPNATNNHNPVHGHAIQTRTPGGIQNPVVASGTKYSSQSHASLPPPQQTASHPLHPLDVTANSVQAAANMAHYQQPQHQQTSQQRRTTVPLSQVADSVNNQHSTSSAPRIPAPHTPAKPPSTPDEEIDTFLRGDSNERNQLNPS
ncbi:hypothetical protein THAOC_23545, partial [Thalassiosira oceanica]